MDNKEEILSNCGLSTEYLSILKEFKDYSIEYVGENIDDVNLRKDSIDLKNIIISRI